ncbi:MAG: hypothetical protein EA362_00180, partial [Saprospirales bacterium]
MFSIQKNKYQIFTRVTFAIDKNRRVYKKKIKLLTFNPKKMKLLLFYITICFFINLNFNYSQIILERTAELDSNANVFMYDVPIELNSLSSKFHLDGTIQIKESYNANQDTILGYLNLDTQTSFVLSRVRPSRFEENVTFTFFQQYYDNIEVEGGGYTIKEDTSTGKLIHFIPHIYCNINISTTPTYTESQVISFFSNDDLLSKELIITNRFEDFNLVWICNVIKNDSLKLYFIDAHYGNILDVVDWLAGINAETFSYGEQNLNDNTVGNITTLEWPNNTISHSLIIYEGFTRNEWITPLGIEFDQLPPENIPSTTNAEWGNDANIISREVFYTTNLVIPAFYNAGIEFGNVRIGTNLEYRTALAHPDSNLDTCSCFYGIRNGVPISLFDAVGHEMGHCFLFNFINYRNPTTNMSLHEGISDILGEYIESFMPGPDHEDGDLRDDYTNDWVIGGDHPEISRWVERDLSQNICFDDFTSQTGHHRRGLVIGHWYYAISTGIVEDNIPAIGMQDALDIVLEALNRLPNRNAGFWEMRTQTLLVAEEWYGVCSPHYQAVVNAWDRVCITGESEECLCDTYDPPIVDQNLIENSCPDLNVNLNDYYTGTPPENNILVWSTDPNGWPESGSIVDPLIELPQNTTYYAYYYNTEEGCYSVPSDGIEVYIESCCDDTDNVYISGNEIFDTPRSIGGDIFIEDQGTLTITNYLEMGEDKRIIVENGGKLVIQGSSAVLTVCNSSSGVWNGIRVLAGGELKTRGGKILNARNGIYAQSDLITYTIPPPVIDIQGIEIVGNSLSDITRGITLFGVTPVNLSESSIENYNYGIYLWGGVGFNVIKNLELKDINFAGIYSIYSNFRVEHSKFINTGIGINVLHSNFGFIRSNIFEDLHTGISTWNSRNMVIFENQMYLDNITNSRGVDLRNTPQSWIFNNDPIQTEEFGVYAFNSPDIEIKTNNFIVGDPGIQGQTQSGMGIYLTACSRSIVELNEINMLRGRNGIQLDNSATVEIKNNAISNASSNISPFSAIRLRGSSNNNIESNSMTCDENRGFGILIINSPGNSISCNVANSFHMGIRINPNSESQIIRGNALDGNFDLHVRSEIGQQFYHGNLFMGGTALGDGLTPQQLSNSRFFVNSEFDYHMPSNPIPGNNEWFLDEDEMEFYECPDGTNIPEQWIPFDHGGFDLCDYYSRLKTIKPLDPIKFYLSVFDLLYFSESLQDFILPNCILLDSNFQSLCGLEEMVDIVIDLEKYGQHELATDILLSYQYQWLETTDSIQRTQLDSL